MDGLTVSLASFDCLRIESYVIPVACTLAPVLYDVFPSRLARLKKIILLFRNFILDV